MRMTILLFAILSATAVFADETSAEGFIELGGRVYSQTCVACHGVNGRGTIPGVVDLTTHSGPLTKSDDQLLVSIREGMQSENTPMVMPAKGGNPSLTDTDIKAVLAFLRAEFGPELN